MKQTRQGLIKFGCINTYTFVRLSTKDAGEGITENTIEQIFKRSHFYSSNKRNKPGLAIYKKTFDQIKNNIAIVRTTEKKSIHQFTSLPLKSKNTDNPAI